VKVKEIVLKKVKRINPLTHEVIKNPDGTEAYLSYREQLWSILHGVGRQEGITTAELMQRAQIQFLLQDAKDEETLYFTPEQFATLDRVLDETRWVIVDSLTANFIKDIKEAKEVEVEPKK
jgi:hypothetical protein